MPLVTVKEKFQVTIPTKVRAQIAIHVGDVLEATVEEGSIVLRPKALVDRAALADRLDALLARTPIALDDAGKSERQILDDTTAEIAATRRERRYGKP
ncbi:MAG: AbrB/MazE/SpoVT family DNA-binding domain-containing protein [Rhodospirillales bacterium]|nr:AbrB/MazE/SpoVT family DNA-binding domain-containing protein [Rhodospirillales bacterium]